MSNNKLPENPNAVALGLPAGWSMPAGRDGRPVEYDLTRLTDVQIREFVLFGVRQKTADAYNKDKTPEARHASAVEYFRDVVSLGNSITKEAGRSTSHPDSDAISQFALWSEVRVKKLKKKSELVALWSKQDPEVQDHFREEAKRKSKSLEKLQIR